jgi:hypothetical protein
MHDQRPADCTIERFAEIVATLHNGRAERASILEAASFDETAWVHVERHWMARLAAGDDDDLAARFGTAYGRASQMLSCIPGGRSAVSAGESLPPGENCARPTATEDETLPTGAVPRAKVDDTIPDPVAPAPPESRSAATEGAEDKQPRSPGAADLTLECAPEAVARNVLPFVAPASAVEAAPPGKRWVYYDTQTGQPLPTPILVDIPEGVQQ